MSADTVQDPSSPATAQPTSACGHSTVLGLRWEDLAPRPVTGWRRYRLCKTDLLLAVVIAAVALLVRWPFIARGETLLHSDEAIVGLMAQDIAEGTRLPIYFYGQRYMGALEAYAIAGLRLLLDDPLLTLRLGPALFFAMFAGLQYLMLTRWFGRSGGLIGAVTLLAAAPMFVQWSISARGGYVEVLLWGSALWWAYSEWFVPPAPTSFRAWRSAALGLLIGSGMWINPTISVFVAPIAVHALLGGPLAVGRRRAASQRWLNRVDRATCGLPLGLPLVAALLVVGLTSLSSVWVSETGIQRYILFNLLPRSYAAALVGCVAIAVLVYLARRTTLFSMLRSRIPAAAPFVLGTVVGLAPAVLYVLQRITAGLPLEDSVPLGMRPLWTLGETVSYLFHGLPLLFGADVKPFMDLVCTGRFYDVPALGGAASTMLAGLNWVVLAATLAAGFTLLRNHGRDIARALRLQSAPHPPVVFLTLALLGLVALYLLGGCSFDFNTVRYLIPVWAILPGLLAAVFLSRRHRIAARASVFLLLVAWVGGQFGFFARVGSPHPLRSVASALTQTDSDVAVAEIFDAHLLSFLTQQRPPVAEHAPFWSRLAHYRTELRPDRPAAYVVYTRTDDWSAAWARTGWPGKAPPETERDLWLRLRAAVEACPGDLLDRTPLADGFELWVMRQPLAVDLKPVGP